VRVFLGIVILILSSFSSGFGQTDEDVKWFESLFTPETQTPADQQIQATENKLSQARETDNHVAEAKALIELGAIQLSRFGNQDRAMEYFINALTLADELRMDREKIFALLAMARIFEEVGNYTKSAELLKQAQQLRETEKDSDILLLILYETGRVNTAYGSLEEAIENYESVLNLATQLELPDAKADALFNLGQLYVLQKKYDTALTIHKNALAIIRSIPDRSKEALSLNKIGELYHFEKNDERAMANHQAALNIRRSLKDKAGLAESHNNIGLLYLEKKDFKNAIENLELALDEGNEVQKKEQIRRSYDYLSQCYKEKKDFKRALEYRELVQSMDEFIQSERNALKLAEVQNRYTLTKKEEEIGKLQLDREKRDQKIEEQEKERNFLILMITLGAIIVALVTSMYFLKRRLAKRLKETNATKDKLFSIIGHDLKGPLNSLTAFASLMIHHGDTLSKEDIKMLSQDLDKSLKNLFALLENLLQWGRSQTGNIDFNPEVFDLAIVLKENHELLKVQAQTKNITIVNENEVALSVKAHQNSINTVVRNLISNAIKFTPKGGTILLSAERKNQHVMISVKDNGVGMNPQALKNLFQVGTKQSTLGTDKEKGTGLGLILCKDFVEKNGGTIGVESKEGLGSRFYFTVPVG
jgi:signal transduction histidine kinase